MSTTDDIISRGVLIKNRWRVLTKLGGGGFGEIYEIEDINLRERYALKVESSEASKQVLKMEVAVLKKLQGKKHCCQFYACGRNEQFNYIVMSLLGRNIADFRRSTTRGCFSVKTALRLCHQMISGIEQMHNAGFLHRDIKPSNFAMGRVGASQNTVYILDFGLARQYRTPTGDVRPPRSAAGFRGTVRYASLTAHKNEEMSRADDFWSFFYMAVEMVTGTLPWKRYREKDHVGQMKENTDNSSFIEEFLGSGITRPDNNDPANVRQTQLPYGFHPILKHISSLKYHDTPDYEAMRRSVEQMMQTLGFNFDGPWDWEEEQPSAGAHASYPLTRPTPGATNAAIDRNRTNVGVTEMPQDFSEADNPPGNARGTQSGGNQSRGKRLSNKAHHNSNVQSRGGAGPLTSFGGTHAAGGATTANSEVGQNSGDYLNRISSAKIVDVNSSDGVANFRGVEEEWDHGAVGAPVVQSGTGAAPPGAHETPSKASTNKPNGSTTGTKVGFSNKLRCRRCNSSVRAPLAKNGQPACAPGGGSGVLCPQCTENNFNNNANGRLPVYQQQHSHLSAGSPCREASVPDIRISSDVTPPPIATRTKSRERISVVSSPQRTSTTNHTSHKTPSSNHHVSSHHHHHRSSSSNVQVSSSVHSQPPALSSQLEIPGRVTAVDSSTPSSRKHQSSSSNAPRINGRSSSHTSGNLPVPRSTTTSSHHHRRNRGQSDDHSAERTTEDLTGPADTHTPGGYSNPSLYGGDGGLISPDSSRLPPPGTTLLGSTTMTSGPKPPPGKPKHRTISARKNRLRPATTDTPGSPTVYSTGRSAVTTAPSGSERL